MYILLLSFAALYNCAIKIQLQLSTLYNGLTKCIYYYFHFPFYTIVQRKSRCNTCKNGLTKCIYNYVLIMHVIALVDYHTLKKSTKYETSAELYTQVSYFVLFTLKKCLRSHIIGTITIWTNPYGPVRIILVLIAYALSLL